MAQQRALFISEKFVKQNSEIDWNADVNLIRPTIWYCQKEYIENSLGTELYDDLIAKVIVGTLAGDDLNLVNNYLADALLKWVMFEAQVPLLFKFRNKSVAKNTDANSQVIDLTEHRYIRDYFKNKAIYFTERMEKFLCANEDKFDLWLNCSDEGVDAKSSKPTTRIYLPSEPEFEPKKDCKFFY